MDLSITDIFNSEQPIKRPVAARNDEENNS